MAKQGRDRRDQSAGGMHVPVDLYRAFVFPNRMREQRHRRGFAKLLPFAALIPEIPYIRLSKIERGEVVARADELRRIAAALRIEPTDLLLDLDAPGFDIARWAEPFVDDERIDVEEERFAVLLGSALRARRTNDAALTIAAIDRDYGLPPVNLSRVENAQKPFARWNPAIQQALFAIFGVSGEAELRAQVEAAHAEGALDGFLTAAADPDARHARSRARIAELAAQLAEAADSTPASLPSNPPVPALPAPVSRMPGPTGPGGGGRMVPVHGIPLPGGLIADVPTGETVEAPRAAGPRAFGLRIGRASLGGGLPAQSIVIADPDRFPAPGGLAVLREADGWRLLAVASARDGRMIGYSVNPDLELTLDDCDPAALATLVGALFV